ncbi:SDR family NAD(P)-dependent oxidoreductase [Polynucleobacter wuianus]|uniref:SDR family NAD(P)-dependent oxidoreductase n=1 Tax=Polynucleobacter wuianus TaxID=1743168 RepID=UPI001C0BE95C|nr:SDR family NAD(P)-dependent oxidoreductase [Polynucleobacter wuianus]
MRHIVVIGATSAIAQACMAIWVKQELTQFTLIARNADHLARITQDLSIKNPDTNIDCHHLDFLDPEAIHSFADRASTLPIDIALIAHGYLPEQEDCETDLTLCKKTIEINALSPALFAEALAQVMEKQRSGKLAVIGSVAGDRGRKSNYVYGASKAFIASYLSGLTHRFANTSIKVTLIKPGPVETPMTLRYKAKGLAMASPEEVAKDIVTAIEKGKAVIYTPGKWHLVMLIIQHLPNFIFNKLNI